jgi:guanylate kinase
MRPSESEDDYTYVDRSTFEKRVAEGGFLEHAEILGERYGTPIPDPGDRRDLVLEIDVQGAQQVRAKRSDVVCVLLVAPSEDEQVARLRARGDSDQQIRARLELSRREVEEGRALCDAEVVNDDVNGAVQEIAGIVAAARRRWSAPSAT